MNYLDRAMDKFGKSVYIDGKETKAFIQPLRRRHRLYLNSKNIPVNYFDNRYFLYIGPADKPLSDGDRVLCNGVKYIVVTTESFTSCGEDIYIWAVLNKE